MFLDNRTSQSLYHLNMFNKYESQAQTLVYKEIILLKPILPN